MTIKEMRTAAGLTQKAFADLLKTSKRNIENWESEKFNDCPEYIRALIEYYMIGEGFIQPEEK